MAIILDRQLREQIPRDNNDFPITYFHDERGSLGDEVKTVEYCFYRRKSIKQGVEGESVPSDAQQLCDWTGICMHLVLFSIISNPISRFIFLSFATFPNTSA